MYSSTMYLIRTSENKPPSKTLPPIQQTPMLINKSQCNAAPRVTREIEKQHERKT